MRPIERIPIFLDELVKHYKMDDDVLTRIKDYWLSNQDLRFTQVLVNLELMDNYPGTWYYMEDLALMLEVFKMAPRDCILWGTFGKSGKDPLKYVLLRDMTDEHIRAVLDTQKHLPDFYQKEFTIELLERKKMGIVLEK